MTLKTRKKRSKLRDLFIIIRLAIRCIAIVLINGLTCVAGKLCGLIKYKSENIWAQPKKRKFVAGVKSTGRPRNISEKFHRRCLRKADQEKKEQKSLQKKRNRTSLESAKCSRLQPPPVEELIFTEDDVWKLKNVTKRSTQTQVPMYSGIRNNVKYNLEAARNSHNNNWLNNFPTSTSRDVKHSAVQEKGRKALVIKSEFVKRCNLEWSQRGKQHYHPSHATSANILQFCY